MDSVQGAEACRCAPAGAFGYKAALSAGAREGCLIANRRQPSSAKARCQTCRARQRRCRAQAALESGRAVEAVEAAEGGRGRRGRRGRRESSLCWRVCVSVRALRKQVCSARGPGRLAGLARISPIKRSFHSLLLAHSRADSVTASVFPLRTAWQMA